MCLAVVPRPTASGGFTPTNFYFLCLRFCPDLLHLAVLPLPIFTSCALWFYPNWLYLAALNLTPTVVRGSITLTSSLFVYLAVFSPTVTPWSFILTSIFFCQTISFNPHGSVFIYNGRSGGKWANAGKLQLLCS